jgi:hypothetical protein
MWQPDSLSLSDAVLSYFHGTSTTLPKQLNLLEYLSALRNSSPTAYSGLSTSGQKKLAGMDIDELSTVLLKMEDYVTSVNPRQHTEVFITLVDTVSALLLETVSATNSLIVMHLTSRVNNGN